MKVSLRTGLHVDAPGQGQRSSLASAVIGTALQYWAGSAVPPCGVMLLSVSLCPGDRSNVTLAFHGRARVGVVSDDVDPWPARLGPGRAEPFGVPPALFQYGVCTQKQAQMSSFAARHVPPGAGRHVKPGMWRNSPQTIQFRGPFGRRHPSGREAVRTDARSHVARRGGRTRLRLAKPGWAGGTVT